MGKKILIAVLVIVVILAAAFLYMNNRNRTLSPPGSASLSNEGMEVAVSYSRPSVRERLIFGYGEEGALQPYDAYWRLGANEPTTIDVNKDFTFGGTPLKAGKYVIYAIPHKGEMELRLSSDLRFWGYTEPDYSKDVATAIVRTEINEAVEQFTIDCAPVRGGVSLVFTWDRYRWSTPLSAR